MDEKIYDLIIVGAGPAGLTAAIYALRAGLHTLLLEKNFVSGGQTASTYEVDNYPGLPGISGAEFGQKIRSHADQLGLVSERVNVKEIHVEEDGTKVIRTRKKDFQARTVLLAVGARHRLLGAKGEERLSGMGISYCATCDGAFYKDQTVAVVGGGNVAVEDAIFLAKICKMVYVVHRRDQLRADDILQKRLFQFPNVVFCWNQVCEEIQGEEQVEAILLKNVKDGSSQRVKVDGVFVAVGIHPNSEPYQGLVDMDEGGYIVAGEDGKTNMPGIFAAGDVRTKKLRQIITAASDGANAVSSVQDYLSRL
ncbi:thioredoxin reductase [Blautia hydrogenotrophica CAG:147]|uniref:thioredoxin-disulfide reductase n=1 Tax=Blautia hydrogenotrophica TaxID=53443 RepID=UPI00033564B3|nr:thioredoxin-disulfide reductase [Blautia hydrogenotrophica]CCX58332.1 thioredoxin reductase [Blautia hydrogenotrophica CAG:147]CUM84983.1 Thioredoxin reductase [Blautia hydrogenotrophica]SCH29169.1 Thioredoxin reductase [uncultured Blautia sp.]